MSHFRHPALKLGIIGGGQLAKMTAQAASQLGFSVTVLDKEGAPASRVADRHIIGALDDEKKIAELVSSVDVATYDIEHISTEPLKRLAEKHEIHPSPQVLELIQDKLAQKRFLEAHGIPTARFSEKLSYPSVQKARRGGYDGYGVKILLNEEDEPLQGDTFFEEQVHIAKELAVMVARAKDGKVACYSVVEMTFDARRPVCSTVIAPARIGEKQQKEAQRLAIAVVEALEGVGVFGIEMFLTAEGKILVNEIAPRPHNSGHYTIEACVTSQFEQHVRAITGLPLGSTDQLAPCVMVNILGEEQEGDALLEGAQEALAIDGVSLHWYGKAKVTPLRKMGHITVIDSSIENALDKAARAMQHLKATTQ